MIKFSLFLLYFITFLFSYSSDNILEKQTIKSNDWISGSFQLVKNPQTSKIYLVTFCSSKTTNKLIIYDNQGKVVFERDSLKGKVYDQMTFQYNGYLYYMADKLYELRLSDFEIIPINIRNKGYRYVRMFNYKDKEYLLTDTGNEIHVYDLDNTKQVLKLKREEDTKATVVGYYEGSIIFNDKDNEIEVYDFIAEKSKWKYNTGSTGLYILGIKVGSITDYISGYKNDENSMYVMTIPGDLYKLNLQTGELLLKKERFGGTGANEGLMPYFSLIDMNNDGIKDVVGGSVDNNVYCINGKDLSFLWKYDTDNEIQLPLSFYDINGDKIPEVFCVNDYDNNLFIFDGKTGKPLIDESVKDENYKSLIQTPVLLADYSGNGLLDLLIMRNSREIRDYEMSDVKVPKDSIIYLPRY